MSHWNPDTGIKSWNKNLCKLSLLSCPFLIKLWGEKFCKCLCTSDMSSNLARSKLFCWSAVSKYYGKSVLDLAFILRSFIKHMDLGVLHIPNKESRQQLQNQRLLEWSKLYDLSTIWNQISPKVWPWRKAIKSGAWSLPLSCSWDLLLRQLLHTKPQNIVPKLEFPEEKKESGDLKHTSNDLHYQLSSWNRCVLYGTS